MATLPIPNPSEELLTPEEAALRLKVAAGTLAVWRCHKRYSLRYVRIGSKIFYRSGDIDRFLEERTVSNEQPVKRKRA